MKLHCKTVCKLCKNPGFCVELIQEEYPEIIIGPYCESCLNQIKICNGCQKPFPKSEVTKETFLCKECNQ